MKVSFLGLGLMGGPMAGRLVRAGHEVTVWNRTTEKAAPLEALGAAVAVSPTKAIEGSPCSLFMVTDAAAVRSLLFPLEGPRPSLASRTIIQMGTIGPGESAVFRDDVAAAGGSYLEAPVLGSTPEAEEGRLFVMAGATPEQFETWRPLLRIFSSSPVLVGPVGKAAALKLALNQLIAAEATAFALSLGIVTRNKIDPEVFMGILRQSSLYTAQFDKKLPRMLARDFAAPSFPAKHMRKDLGLILAEARRLGLETRAVEAVEALVAGTVQSGRADEDYSAVYAVIDPI